MKALLKKFVATVAAIAMIAAPQAALVGGVAHAQVDIRSNICSGASVGTDECEDSDGEGFNAIVTNVINIFSIVVGAVSVIMIIVGGFRYIISGGDSNGVQGAKNTILYAIVGLVIVLFAQVIVNFVLDSTNTQ